MHYRYLNVQIRTLQAYLQARGADMIHDGISDLSTSRQEVHNHVCEPSR